ncbi:hypothetical protein [Streptomyces sp. MP131-18]|uniref:hypothetical protein n=1 Tax=Streptomyces sp. MP131-18 TaxID=1857892 RepID=UPI00117D7E53|nr:hypothetical protein [Streptomyces sp. MP131-18]
MSEYAQLDRQAAAATLHPLIQASPGLTLRAQRMLDAIYEGRARAASGPAFEVDPGIGNCRCQNLWNESGGSSG